MEGILCYHVRKREYASEASKLGKSGLGPGSLTTNFESTVGLQYRRVTSLESYLLVLQEHLSMVQTFNKEFDWRVEGPALSNLANCYQQLRKFELALERHRQRLALAQKHSDVHGEMVSHSGMGNAMDAMGGRQNIERALRHRRRALELARQLPVPMPRELAGACRNLGLSLLRQCKVGYLGDMYSDSFSLNGDTGGEGKRRGRRSQQPHERGDGDGGGGTLGTGRRRPGSLLPPTPRAGDDDGWLGEGRRAAAREALKLHREELRIHQRLSGMSEELGEGDEDDEEERKEAATTPTGAGGDKGDKRNKRRRLR